VSAATASLRANLEQALELPPAAVDYLCELFECIQALDDWVDGDPVTREDKDRAIWGSFAGLQLQPWFLNNSPLLLPLHATAVLKWKGADTVERSGGNLHVAYVWRAGFFDIVLQCVLIAHGAPKAMRLAHLVIALYGESFDDYAKEFTRCQIPPVG
jgi:hypothetical protein